MSLLMCWSHVTLVCCLTAVIYGKLLKILHTLKGKQRLNEIRQATYFCFYFYFNFFFVGFLICCCYYYLYVLVVLAYSYKKKIKKISFVSMSHVALIFIHCCIQYMPWRNKTWSTTSTTVAAWCLMLLLPLQKVTRKYSIVMGNKNENKKS